MYIYIYIYVFFCNSRNITFLNFEKFLDFSMNLDIFEHVREIPTKFHLDFDEKYHFLVENCELSIEFSIFNFAKMLLIFN